MRRPRRIPWQFLYDVALYPVGYFLVGWWGVLLVFLAQCGSSRAELKAAHAIAYLVERIRVLEAEPPR